MTGKYGVIYADPPWSFQTYSHKGKGRSAESWYDCMSLAEIKTLPVADFAAKDCVLLLWITDPMLPRGLEVISAWGFTYKTVGFYWAKTVTGPELAASAGSWTIGTGYWTRANPEQCLLATRGKPKRRHADVRRLVVAPRRQHSQKPDEVYDRIERLCSGPYLELFARQHRLGWEALGIEADSGPGQRRWRSDGYPEPKQQ